MIPTKKVLFGIGPLLVAPTASSRTLRAGKWQAGAAGARWPPQISGLLALLVTYQNSFAGTPSRPESSLLTAQPIVTYNLRQGWYLRSTGTWNFDFIDHTDYIPVGFGIGKVWLLGGGITLNAFVEPQYSVLRSGVEATVWQMFGGVNFQFPLQRSARSTRHTQLALLISKLGGTQ